MPIHMKNDNYKITIMITFLVSAQSDDKVMFIISLCTSVLHFKFVCLLQLNCFNWLSMFNSSLKKIPPKNSTATLMLVLYSYLLRYGRLFGDLCRESTHNDLQVALQSIITVFHSRLRDQRQQVTAQGETTCEHLIQLK